MTSPKLDLNLAKQVAARAELRGIALAHKIGTGGAIETAHYQAQTSALLVACAGTIDALVTALEDRNATVA